MLKQLKLHNFRTYLNADMSFTQRHLVIGRNNSGKTNLCAALNMLRMTTTGNLAESAQIVPGGIAELKNWAFDSTIVEVACTCELPFDGDQHTYTYELALELVKSPSQEGPLRVRVSREQLVVDGPGFSNVVLLHNDGHEANMLHEEAWISRNEPHVVTTLAPSDATMLSKLYELETNRRAVSFRRYLSNWHHYALSPEAMRYGWRDAPSGATTLVPRGDNLAVVLFQLKNIDEQRYRRVIRHVQIIEPDLEAINFYPVPEQAIIPFVALRHCPRASWIGLSDGTLRCLALALIGESVGSVSGAGKGSPSPFVVIEEPENGIYPGQLRSFFDEFEDRTGVGQIVFTSHSPYFINFFDGDRNSVTLLRRNRERTEISTVPPADNDPDRPLLAEQYSMELFD